MPFGDGGAVVTDNQELADNVRKISNHGQLKTHHAHSIIGRNSRLDSIQASILRVKLNHLARWNENRINAAKYYISKLKDIDSLFLPSVQQNRTHVYHLFVIRSKQRNELIEALSNSGIASGIHYPTPLPFLEAYNYKRHKPGDFPIASGISGEILSLPVYPEITAAQIDTICEILIKASSLKHN